MTRIEFLLLISQLSLCLRVVHVVYSDIWEVKRNDGRFYPCHHLSHAIASFLPVHAPILFVLVVKMLLSPEKIRLFPFVMCDFVIWNLHGIFGFSEWKSAWVLHQHLEHGTRNFLFH